MKKIVTILLISMTVTYHGQNVGIGTNNPLSMLHVAGTVKSDTLIYIGQGVRNLFATSNGRIYDSLVTSARGYVASFDNAGSSGALIKMTDDAVNSKALTGKMKGREKIKKFLIVTCIAF